MINFIVFNQQNLHRQFTYSLAFGLTACPRRADAYLVALAGEYPGSPIAEVCQGVRIGLQQARVAAARE